MDEKLAPSAPKRPDVKAILASKAKTFRMLASDLEDLGDALGFRPLTQQQNELLADLVSGGVDCIVESINNPRVIRY